MIAIRMISPKNSVAVMGILNVTPDSFYDGGKFDALDTAVHRAIQMTEEGADIIDIGGESTGPRSGTVMMEEELRRVIPVIGKIRKYERNLCKTPFVTPGRVTLSSPSPFGGAQDKLREGVSKGGHDRATQGDTLCRGSENMKITNSNDHFRISVDTYKAEVAEAALDAGASMVNDVTAGRGDPAMFSLIAEKGCSYIMMRSKDDSPRTTMEATSYENILVTIHTFFEERIHAAEKVGIDRQKIILDPGLGHFVSSDPKYSWHILENLEFLQDFGCRILVSPSRKSFTAEFPEQPPEERLPGTLRATLLALKHGATIIRTHDVRETKALTPPKLR